MPFGDRPEALAQQWQRSLGNAEFLTARLLRAFTTLDFSAKFQENDRGGVPTFLDHRTLCGRASLVLVSHRPPFERAGLDNLTCVLRESDSQRTAILNPFVSTAFRFVCIELPFTCMEGHCGIH